MCNNSGLIRVVVCVYCIIITVIVYSCIIVGVVYSYILYYYSYCI